MRTEENRKQTNPTFRSAADFDRNAGQLMQNLDEVLGYLAPQWHLDWDERDEVRSITLLKATRSWAHAPRDRGQKAWLAQVAWSACADMLKFKYRAFVDPSEHADDPVKHAQLMTTLERCAGESLVDPARLLELIEVSEAIDGLHEDAPGPVDAFVLHHAEGHTWPEVGAQMHKDGDKCKSSARSIKKRYAQRYPDHRELIWRAPPRTDALRHPVP